MESFKTNFLIFVFIVIIGALAYWATQSLKSSTDSLLAENTYEDVGPVVTSSPSEEIVDLPPTPEFEPEPEPETPEPKPTPEPAGEHATLIADLQELIDDKVLMKKGSRGTRVGVVQKFLIEYGIDMDADNDYGDTTVNAVKKFQTQQKLSADGQTGEGTYKKMIEWLENN